MAAGVPWSRLATDILSQGLGVTDPSFLFAWPFARVLAVFFFSTAADTTPLDTPEKKLEWINRQRAKRNEPPLDALPPPKARR